MSKVTAPFERSIEIQTDASKNGLGAVMLQERHPIAFASRNLTKTVQKYAQIEIELLAKCFSVEMFHIYICGQKDITVATDHKPLLITLSFLVWEVSDRKNRGL
ncbi:Hypothetical protein CINCED_3A007891 [Cinara cedri]|uniref:Reverse transcriptase RNase H-like domain-containing protein n=1 Tax=Cinara cedri TaxID=506608 RepID=A0A5E4NKD2_9HEMI|nr:Hypothetical protein CINCED_3A007891 [Cinara cedri]